jgi:hypothetical protein
VTDLQEYSNPKVNTPLPDTTDEIVAVLGAVDGGTKLRFAVKQELFINGPGACAPSQVNCQDIDLAPGQIETFQYDSPTLGLVQYELTVVSVDGHTAASTASLTRGVLRHATRQPQPVVNAGPIHGQPVPVPLTAAQVSALMLSRGVPALAPQLVGSSG